MFKENQTLIGSLNAFVNKEKLENLKSKNKLFSLATKNYKSTIDGYFIIQANRHYKAVVEAFQVYERAIPMMMTAAGTIPAAKVLVVGAGVVITSIATAKRMGAWYRNRCKDGLKEQVEI